MAKDTTNTDDIAHEWYILHDFIESQDLSHGQKVIINECMDIIKTKEGLSVTSFLFVSVCVCFIYI